MACLDPLVGSGRFDFVVRLGAELPIRTIGMSVGIPEVDQPSDATTSNATSRNSRAGRWRPTRMTTSTAISSPRTSSGGTNPLGDLITSC